MALSARASFPRFPIRSAGGAIRDQSCRYSSHRHPQLDDAGHIRLLKLLRGSFGSPIKCEFLSMKLDTSVPKYNAISYSWGEPALKHKIECEGHELGVTGNAKVLLDHLRDPDEDKIIWIDAICIDQANFEERSRQVRLMGQIYSSAEFVYIWLGPDEHDSELLEEFLPRLADVFSTARRTQLFTDEVLFQKTKTERISPEWMALKKLFERPWFNRTWVVQEVVASTQHVFVCGKQRIPADLLVLVAKELRYLYLNGNGFIRDHGFNFTVISKFLRMARIWTSRKKGVEANLSYLTYSFWTSKTSDPKDKIFSMLGLDNEMAIRIEPDYRHSVQAVYTQATRESLLIGKSTRILSLAGIGHHRILVDLPSWVPDFSSTETPSPPFGLHMYNGSNPNGWGSYNGHILNKTLAPYQFEGRRFTLDAIKFDSIKRLGTILNIEDEGCLGEWANETEDLFMTSNYVLRGKFPSWEIHWRSLIANRTFKYASYMVAPPTYGRYYEALRQQLDIKTTANRNSAQERFLHESRSQAGKQVTQEMRARRFVSALWQSAHGRKYCVTGKSDVGLVPRYAAVGDIICMLAGCDVPFIVRPVPGSGKEGDSELVGECFVYGMMLGSRKDLGEFSQITLV